MASDLKWYERPVRMMRLDYLGEMTRMRDADLDALAKSKRDDWHINCEWVVATLGSAPGLGYQTTFNTPKFEKNPPLGDFDVIREYLPHAKKYGLHVLGYMNMHWFAFDFADKHPGWEQLLSDGTAYGRLHPLYGSGTTLCVNSGWRDWAIELIGETMNTGLDGVFLDGPVIYPGACYCDACREKFSAKHGVEMPVTEDWSDPDWAKFVQFRSDSLAEFLRDSRAMVKSVNPDGVAFLNAGTWHANTWRFARSLDCVSDHEDFNGAEEFFHPGAGRYQMLGWSATAKYMAAAGKPAIVFSHDALGAWHYIPLPKIEVQIGIAQTVACGANPWFAVFDYALDHSRDEAVEAVRGIQEFLASHEEYYTATESLADIALLNSSQTATFYVSDYGELYGEAGAIRETNLGIGETGEKRVADWQKRKGICEGTVDGSYLGYFDALTRSHIPFDVILDKHVSAEGLAKYRVLILPNSACLSDAQIEAIQRFVARGGSVVAEFETGAYDENGHLRDHNPLLGTLGVSEVGKMMWPSTAEQYVRITSPQPSPKKRGGRSEAHPAVGGFLPGRLIARPRYSLECSALADAQVLSVFMNAIPSVYSKMAGESDLPAMIVKEQGAGRTVYLPSLVGEFYNQFRMQDYRELIESAVRWAHVEPMAIEIDAPSTVEMEPRRYSPSLQRRGPGGGGQMLIHLVNNSGDMQRPMEEILPVRDVRIRLRGLNVIGADALRAGESLSFQIGEDTTDVILPELGLYELVVVDTV